MPAVVVHFLAERSRPEPRPVLPRTPPRLLSSRERPPTIHRPLSPLLLSLTRLRDPRFVRRPRFLAPADRSAPENQPMKALARPAALFIALPLVALLAGAAAIPSQWKTDLLAWRTNREQGLAKPDSWLTLVGLDWLQPGASTVGSAPDNRIRLSASAPAHLGTIQLSGNQVRLVPPPEGFPSSLQIDGKPAHETVLADDGDDHPSVLTAGSFTLTVIHRGDRFALRIKEIGRAHV